MMLTLTPRYLVPLAIVIAGAASLPMMVGACNEDPSRPDASTDVRVAPPEMEDGGDDDSPYYFSTPHTGAPSSLRSCVNRDDTSLTLECVLCPSGEICFTQLVCGPINGGGGGCSERSESIPRGDNRCHRECDTSNDCGPSEDCFHEPFTACTDYNGGPRGRGLCCSFGGCEN
jgi:hypothetical protein